jgi:hypothetical protein
VSFKYLVIGGILGAVAQGIAIFVALQEVIT